MHLSRFLFPDPLFVPKLKKRDSLVSEISIDRLVHIYSIRWIRV